jgi:biopolymer transport protein ExbD
MDRLGYEDSSFDMSIDLTPMVDVLFMLLIFFITATTFVKPIMDVNLATAKSATNGTRSGNQVVLAVTEEGTILLENRPVQLEELAVVFREQSDRPINLFVDRNAPFQAFLSVIDLAKQHNRDDLVVTTRPDDEI